ncbi:UbiA prenyltransferase family protein, partial [Candidatus Bathyarchaeota archaeon]|nr:UbiA prenyltransferase family protein [Candidatus Bathyarchaeota archaeon]
QIRLKRMFVIKDLVIASGFILCSLIGSTAVTGGIHWPGVFAGFSFGVLGFLVNPSINDSFDVKEDRKYEIRSLAAELSWHAQVQMLGAAVIYIVAASVYAVYNLGFNSILPVPVILFSILVFRQLPVIYPEFNAEKILKMRKTIKAFVFFTHLMFLASSLNLGLLF